MRNWLSISGRHASPQVWRVHGAAYVSLLDEEEHVAYVLGTFPRWMLRWCAFTLSASPATSGGRCAVTAGHSWTPRWPRSDPRGLV
ncbi:MAG: hypothetical protein Ct9H300mP12_17140 [Acidimicrobiales bacterium]|nr:MAG: hypothetical protein Ct9H300mP12_17140 [Acidimicrobiales bacterium]